MTHTVQWFYMTHVFVIFLCLVINTVILQWFYGDFIDNTVFVIFLYLFYSDFNSGFIDNTVLTWPICHKILTNNTVILLAIQWFLQTQCLRYVPAFDDKYSDLTRFTDNTVISHECLRYSPVFGNKYIDFTVILLTIQWFNRTHTVLTNNTVIFTDLWAWLGNVRYVGKLSQFL